MNNLVVQSKAFDEISAYLPEHGEMLQVIEKNLPEIIRETSLFGKTQSQFMDNLLTVSHPTPFRNIRQCLSEIERARNALKEAHFKIKKQEIDMVEKEFELRVLNETPIVARIELEEKKLGRKLLNCEHNLFYQKEDCRKQRLDLEIAEIKSQIEGTQLYISGAVRKITNHIEQINSIKEAHGIKDFNEFDFEAEEEKYHIMKAFEQGLCAARSHHGMIDEGNQIYFMQIGVNGSVAQALVSNFLKREQDLLAKAMQAKEGETVGVPGHGMVLEFLTQMAERFKGCSGRYAQHKGMRQVTDKALLKQGDTRHT